MNQELNDSIAVAMGWKVKKVRGSSEHHYTDQLGPEEITIEHFYPSEQIADAWIVIEELQKKFDGFILSKTKDKEFECSILRQNHNNAYFIIATAEATTAPEAICKAALKAVTE